MFEPDGKGREGNQDPYLHSVPQFMQNAILFSFLANTLGTFSALGTKMQAHGLAHPLFVAQTT